MKNGQVHHIEYYVNDIKKTRVFWSWFLERLGYKDEGSFTDGFTLSHSSGTYFTFVEVEKDLAEYKNNRNASGLNHIAFHVDSLSTLQELENELKEKEVKILKFDHKHICFEELNGFAVEIFV